MKKAINILSTIIIIFLVLSLISNIIISINEKTILKIISFRNLFLIGLIFSVIYKSKFTYLLLLILSIFFWYNYFFSNDLNSFHSNAIIYFSANLFEVLKFYINNIFLKKIILIIPFISFLLITFLIIPARAKYFFNSAK